MRKQSYSHEHSKSWHVSVTEDEECLDPNAIEIRGLQLHGVVDTRRPLGKVALIESRIKENSERRASQLRTLTVEVLNRAFEVRGETLEDAELIVAELVQNAFRYSVTGPVWVSIVQVATRRSGHIVDITVANGLEKEPVAYVYPDENDDDLPVGGRGQDILDALAMEHGRFQDVRTATLGAYALMQVGRND